MTLDLNRLRADFPTLSRRVHGHPLIYLDNAATSHKPRQVIETVNRYYRQQNSNVHRAAHTLSGEATRAFEQARQTVASFINAGSSEEIIWTRGTTEAINLVANSLGGQILQPGDEILLTELEHHANIVPWQLVAQRMQAKIKVLPIEPTTGELQLSRLDDLLTERTKIVSFSHTSNALGVINPVQLICNKARAVGAISIVDGAQSSAHFAIDVQSLGCDFFAFSGHKVFAPTGIGCLWGRKELLEQMPPWQGGGEMIRHVSFEHTEFQPAPFKFEPGTPNISGALGFAAAIDYLNNQDRSALHQHEQTLLAHAVSCCKEIPGFTLYGQTEEKVSVLSFQLAQGHQQDIGMLLDQQGIAVRVGHHCAMPLMHRLGLQGTVRASFAFYNTLQEVERFAEALRTIQVSLENPHSIAVTSTIDTPDIEQLTDQIGAQQGWNAKYRILMKLGNQLTKPEADIRLDTNLINGCESKAWLDYQLTSTGKLQFEADSDARIIRGLIALTLSAFNNKTTAEIIDTDIDRYFEKMGLIHHLSPSRSNGLNAIVAKVRAIAASHDNE